MDQLRQFEQTRSLVSLRRAAIDANSIQGFVLGASERLVLLQYVYDFNLDGLMLLRIEDVSEVSRSKTDEFQEQLLLNDGLLSRVPFNHSLNLDSWSTAIKDLRESHSLLIFECELIEEREFVIGRVLEVGAEEVSMQHFTGSANWVEEPVRVKFDDITSCQANTNYLNAYQRHFERIAP